MKSKKTSVAALLSIVWVGALVPLTLSKTNNAVIQHQDSVDVKRAVPNVASTVQEYLDAGISVLVDGAFLTAEDTIPYANQKPVTFIGNNPAGLNDFPGWRGDIYANSTITLTNIRATDEQLNFGRTRILTFNNCAITIAQDQELHTIDELGVQRTSVSTIAAFSTKLTVIGTPNLAALNSVRTSSEVSLRTLIPLQRLNPERLASVEPVIGVNEALTFDEMMSVLNEPTFASYNGLVASAFPVETLNQVRSSLAQISNEESDAFKRNTITYSSPTSRINLERGDIYTTSILVRSDFRNNTTGKKISQYVSETAPGVYQILSGADRNSVETNNMYDVPTLGIVFKSHDNAMTGISILCNWFELDTNTFEFTTGNITRALITSSDLLANPFPVAAIRQYDYKAPNTYDFGIRGRLVDGEMYIERYETATGNSIEEFSPYEGTDYITAGTDDGRILLVSENDDGSFVLAKSTLSEELGNEYIIKVEDQFLSISSVIENLKEDKTGYVANDGTIYVPQLGDVFTPNPDGTYNTNDIPSLMVIITNTPEIIYADENGKFENEASRYFPSNDGGLVTQDKNTGEVIFPDGTRITGETPVVVTKGDGSIEVIIPDNGTITFPSGVESSEPGIYDSKTKTVIMESGTFITLSNNDKIGLPSGGTLDSTGNIHTDGEKILVPANKTGDLLVNEDGTIILPEGTTIVNADGNEKVIDAISVYEDGVITKLFSFTAFAGNEGTFVSSVQNGLVKSGSSIMLTATPNDGNVFQGWYVDAVKVSDEANYVLILTEDVRIEARFSLAPVAPPLDDNPIVDGTAAIVAISIILALATIAAIGFTIVVINKSKKD